MEHVRGWVGLLVLVALSGCGEVAMLEELAPDHSCRRTISVGLAGVPLASVSTDSQDPDAATVEASDDPAVEAPDPDPDPPPEDDPDADPDDSAADEASDAPDVDWFTPRSDVDRRQLNAWCAAVGPAVAGGWADPEQRPLDSLVVVSWNVHIGGGDLERLVDDLRAGALTGGTPVDDFVLLLQEAYRRGDDIPAWRNEFPFGSGTALAPPSGVMLDVVEQAEELGLAVFYAPSMRSGQGTGAAPTDRGNAILSTLPLENYLAIELPVARQRRVAVSARVSGTTSTGEDWALDVASVHLENDARGWANDARARLLQGEALLEGLSDEDMAIAAGDFNSWTQGQEEAIILEMLDAYPDTPPFPVGPTYVRGYGLVRRYLDYMFFRLPDDARASYRRIEDPYNSDHYPLLGQVVFPPG